MVEYSERAKHILRAPTVLVYGAHDSGKTRLIATMPQPVLIADLEDGLLSIERDELDKTAIPVASHADMRTVTAMIASGKFKSFVVDSLSVFSDIVAAECKSEIKNKYDVWPEYESRIAQFVRACREVEIPVLLIARETSSNIGDEKNEVMRYDPAFAKKSSSGDVPSDVDYCFRLTGTKKKTLSTRSSMVTAGKDRSGLLDEQEPADMSAIFAKLRAAIGE
jgi:hypothetical protein